MNPEVKTIMSDEFAKDYNFYKDYDDIVIHKKSHQIFKANFISGRVQLVPLSNQSAMEKIEAGMNAFVKQLKKEGF